MTIKDLNELVLEMTGANEGAEVVKIEGQESGASRPPETLLSFHLKQVASRMVSVLI